MKEKIKAWFYHYPISSLDTQYQQIPQEKLLWNHKPLVMNSFLVWDFENIGLQCFEAIKALVKFTPLKLYVISKRPIRLFVQRILQEEGFILFENYPGSADDKIIALIKMHQDYSHLILVSSDSDFVPTITSYLASHHVQWIMRDSNKKRICMKINLAHPRLTLSTFESQKSYSQKPHSNYANQAFNIKKGANNVR